MSLAAASRPETQLWARLLAGIEFLGRSACRWYEGGICPWRFFRRGPTLRRETLALAKRLRGGVWGAPSAERRRLIDRQLAELPKRRRERRRRSPLSKKEAARQVFSQSLEAEHIRTDADAKFPRVLSFDEWQAVRRAEQQREQARLTLQQEKEQHRLTYLVARGGQPLPEVDDKLKTALASFTDACRQAQPLPTVDAGPAIDGTTRRITA
jgi:multidrug efflux pump subunit AcrA (membrane-fusion protein)